MPENDRSKDGTYDELRERIARNQARPRVDRQDRQGSKVGLLRVAVSRTIEGFGILLESSVTLWLTVALTFVVIAIVFFVASQ